MTRVALVTGAGSGIGRGIALALARRGISIALTGRRRTLLEQVGKEIAEYDAQFAVLPADLSVCTERQALIERTHASLGRLDILVNNAGVLMGGDLTALTAQDIEQAVAVNLTACIDLTRLALADLTSQRGSVVFISSNAHHVPLPAASLYTATKSALGNLAESLRYELEPRGIHVLLVHPPDTDTAMVQGMTRRSGLSLPWVASPGDVGEHIAQGIESRKQVLRWGASQKILTVLYRRLPWLVRGVFRAQRMQLTRMMTSAQEDRRKL